MMKTCMMDRPKFITISTVITVVFILLTRQCNVHATFLLMELEDMAGHVTDIPHRVNASQARTVHLYKGEKINFELCLMTKSFVKLNQVGYSNDGPSDHIQISVDNLVIDDFRTAAHSNVGHKWETHLIHNGSLEEGKMFSDGRRMVSVTVIESDQFGVEIDFISLWINNSQSIDSLKCAVFCFENIAYADDMSDYVSTTTNNAIAVQKSVPTNCAEEDNVNVPVFHATASKFVISATLPKYTSFSNSREPDFTHCKMAQSIWSFGNISLDNDVTKWDRTSKLTIIRGAEIGLFTVNQVNITIEFALADPSGGTIESDIGMQIGLKQDKFNGPLFVTFIYYDRYSRWSSPQTGILNSSNWDLNFDVSDFSFRAGSGNVVQITVSSENNTLHGLDDVTFAELYMKQRKMRGDETSTLYRDEVTIIESVDIDMWWRINETMTVSFTNNNQTFHNADYIRVYQNVPWVHNGVSQVFVLYQDGNVRLLPVTPHGLDWIPFGSSVLLGQSDPNSKRPCAPISHINIDPISLTLFIIFKDGGRMNLQIKATSLETKLIASHSSYARDPSHFPFFTMRSMYVADGKCDVDHVSTNGEQERHILDNWESLHGTFFVFYRKCISTHNTLSPDIRLKILA